MTASRPSHPLTVLMVLLLVALVGPAGAGGQVVSAPTTTTPVLGTSALSADQLVAWYASTGVVSRSPTPIPTLALLFLDEGAAQGVRGDLAFAQSMLETGYLRYGGQVRPGDHNFSGLGACDSCPRGLAFPDPTTGVRAQIQHLWAYASPTARAEATARPNVDIRFDLVSPKGRAPTWERMGAGNWATDPDYARKVLAIHAAMLRHAGLPEDAARTRSTPPSPTPTLPRVVRASPNGAVHLSTWAPHRTGLAGAPATLGTPRGATARPAGCLTRWPALAVVAISADGCAASGTPERVHLGAGWRTARGLAVGDPVNRLRALYPGARRVGALRHLVSGRERGRPMPRLSAEVRGGRVRALIASARQTGRP